MIYVVLHIWINPYIIKVIHSLIETLIWKFTIIHLILFRYADIIHLRTIEGGERDDYRGFARQAGYDQIPPCRGGRCSPRNAERYLQREDEAGKVLS